MSEKDFEAQYDGGFEKEYLRATWLAQYYDGDESHPEVTQILGEDDGSCVSLEIIDDEDETFVRDTSHVPLEEEG